MGAYFYTQPRVMSTVRQLVTQNKKQLVEHGVLYAGRAPSASPAAGYSSDHEKQQKALVHDAFHIKHASK